MKQTRAQHAAGRPRISPTPPWLAVAASLIAAASTLPTAQAAGEWAAVSDPKDMADTSGDIRAIAASVQGTDLHLSMTIVGVAAPATEQTPEGMSNRYYYHWLLDTDNNPATGRSNAEYEGNPNRGHQAHRGRALCPGRLARRQAQRHHDLRSGG